MQEAEQWPPKDVHLQIPGTYAYIMLHDVTVFLEY